MGQIDEVLRSAEVDARCCNLSWERSGEVQMSVCPRAEGMCAVCMCRRVEVSIQWEKHAAKLAEICGSRVMRPLDGTFIRRPVDDDVVTLGRGGIVGYPAL